MLGDSVVLTVLSQVAFMPVLVLAARLCPEVRGSLMQCVHASEQMPCLPSFIAACADAHYPLGRIFASRRNIQNFCIFFRPEGGRSLLRRL